jgi:phage shock protein C
MASYCPACGGVVSEGANFCSACGKAIAFPNAANFAAGPPRPLVRPKLGRKIAGVCQGLATYYRWDVTLTRVIAVLLAVFTFPVGLIAYAVCWLVVPEETLLAPNVSSLHTTR